MEHSPPRLRLILDTNVVLDAFHFADPAALPLIAARKAGETAWFTDSACLDELARVVGYPEFGLDTEAGRRLVEAYRLQVEMIEPDGDTPPRLPRCRDKDDQKFLELALRAGADLLVSKDKALLRLKGRTGLPYRIVTPAEAGQEIQSRRRRNTQVVSSEASAANS